MNDQIKFSCLSCGQHIECDVTETGRPMLCPSCGANLTVPHVMSESPAPPVLEPDPERASAAAPPPVPQISPRTSGLAIASLVCSLLSPFICFCCLAGIICGHLARRAIRHNPMLTGKGVAMAGLVISYMALILLSAFAAFIFNRANHFKSELESMQLLSTNRLEIPSAQSQTSVDSNETQQAQSNGTGPGWTLDVKNATIPSDPVGGEIHGADFQLKRALFRNGNLRFVSSDGREFVMIHSLGDSIENRSLEFQTASGNDAPKVEIGWKDDNENKTATFQDGYALELKFDAAKGRRIPGQIYLSLPDDSKSYIAGTFTIVLPKPKAKAAAQ